MNVVLCPHGPHKILVGIQILWIDIYHMERENPGNR